MEEKYGEVEEMNVCDNLGDHLVGNVYVKVGVVSKSSVQRSHYCYPVAVAGSRSGDFCLDDPSQFRTEEDAEKAVIDLNNRWFNGQPIHAELSPVTDFREACCRQYEMG